MVVGAPTKLVTGFSILFPKSISEPGTLPSALATSSGSRWRGSVQTVKVPASEKSTGAVSATRFLRPSGRSAACMAAMVPPMQ